MSNEILSTDVPIQNTNTDNAKNKDALNAENNSDINVAHMSDIFDPRTWDNFSAKMIDLKDLENKLLKALNDWSLSRIIVFEMFKGNIEKSTKYKDNFLRIFSLNYSFVSHI